jgi:plastocyanin
MTNSLRRSGFICAAVLAAAALLPIVGASRDYAATASPREIRLTARDMAFYLEGHDEPNPTLTVRAGEQIRLVLRNAMPGMAHDLVIASWQVQTSMLQKKDEETVVSFRVPDGAETVTYHCTPHAEMMRGSINIE